MNATSVSTSMSSQKGSFYIFAFHAIIYLQRYLVVLIILINFFTGLSYFLIWKSQSLAGRAFAHILMSRSIHMMIYGAIDFGYRANWQVNSPSLCIFTGYIHQVIWISEYGWLVVVTFDFWRRFRNLNPRRVSFAEDSKYIYYSLFAWGSSLSVTSTSLMIYYGTLNTQGTSAKFVPDFGSCSVSKAAMIIYVIPVISVFVLAALTFAFLTYKSLSRHRNETVTARMAKQKKSDISSFQLFWRLSILMGLNWIIEFMIGVILLYTLNFDEDETEQNSYAHFLWLIGGLILLLYMSLSAGSISYMFVFNNRAVVALLNRKIANITERARSVCYRQSQRYIDEEHLSNVNVGRSSTDDVQEDQV